MSSPEDLVAKARSSEWGFIEFSHERVLFMRLNSKQVLLIEPSCGYFFPDEDECKQSTKMPDAKTLASTLSGVSSECLDAIEVFASEPRTMREIEAAFVGVEA